jgi:hypothetical protein
MTTHKVKGRSVTIPESDSDREMEIALAALQAVIGQGYCEMAHPCGQDYVSKEAIAMVRKALRVLEAA